MTAADWFLAYCFSATFLTLCVLRSRTHFLWADEIFGYRVLSAQPFSSVVKGWWEGADGGGPVYYLLAKVWIHFFGLSALTLRLFSAAGMCTAVLLLWITARRFLSTVAISFSMGLVYLIPLETRWQEVNGRFYVLFSPPPHLRVFASFLLQRNRLPAPDVF